MSPTRRAGLSLGLAGGLALLALAPSTALALPPLLPATPPTFASPGTEAGQLSTPSAVATNDTTHDVYIADPGNARIDQFDSAGTFVRAFGWGVLNGAAALQTCEATCQAGVPGAGNGQLSNPAGLAVDNDPSSPSFEDLYVADAANDKVEKFGPSGAWLGEDIDGSAAPQGAFTGLAAIATDGSGDLWTVDSATADVDEFDSTGAYVPASQFSDGYGATVAIAVNPGATKLYLIDANGPTEAWNPADPAAGPTQVDDGGSLYSAAEFFHRGAALAVDPRRGDLYVEDLGFTPSFEIGATVVHYDAAGRMLDHFGGITAGFGQPQGLAFDPAAELPGSDLGALYAPEDPLGDVRLFVPPPPSPPGVIGSSSANVAGSSADLRAQINPNGHDTTYRFEYGTTSTYGASAPLPDQDIGSAESPQSVSVHLTELQPGAIYHFRVVAHSSVGTTTSEDQTFEFLPPACPNAKLRQLTGAAYLPDCRGYELVSPVDADGTNFWAGGMRTLGGAVTQKYLANGWLGVANSPVATDPARLAFTGSLGAPPDVGDAPNNCLISCNQYIATRTDSGWVSRYVGLPANFPWTPILTGESQCDPYCPADLEMGEWADPGLDKLIGYQGATTLSEPPGAPYLFDVAGDQLGRWPTNLAIVPGGDTAITASEPSPDLNHFFFTSSTPFAPGGLSEPGVSLYDNDIANGTVQVVSRLPGGGNIPGPVSFPGAAGLPRSASSDGSHLLIAAAAAPQCSENGCNTDPQAPLYMRVDDSVTYDVSRGASAEFLGMAPDGSRVYFITTAQLTPDDHDQSADLYMWSEATDSLTRLSTGLSATGDTDSCSASWIAGCGVSAPLTTNLGTLVSNGATDNLIAAANGDIYFYSPERLDGAHGAAGQMNLYDYREGRPRYVATLEPNNPITRIQVSPDDTHAAFLTASPLTSYENIAPNGICSYNNRYGPTGPRCEEMYSYTPTTSALHCVSCLPDGEPPTSDVLASRNGLFMSDDGRTFFSTKDPLVPQDTDGIDDVYEFVNGRPQLLTSGTGSIDTSGGSQDIGNASAPGLIGVTADGVNTYFFTHEALLGQGRDQNGGYSRIYDARTNGGFAFNPPSPPCDAADECHGPSTTARAAAQLGTAAPFGSGGNAKAAKKHHGRERHKKHHKQGQGKPHHDRAANANRGGVK